MRFRSYLCGVHHARGGGRDAAHALQEVERHALAGQDGQRAALQAAKGLPWRHALAVRGGPLDTH